ncbi:MAG: hypothetical protein JWN64_781 [Parcubacteria group bacterium]|nr:hypothetical protein [Parcubacteria group bacterium]
MKYSSLTKEELTKLYLAEKLSVRAIANLYSCSEQRINYWLHKFEIEKRSISESLYLKHNPSGDPFFFKEPKTLEEAFLFGLGIGLYWGEGNKKNTHSIRLGNTDPKLIVKFIEFLTETYGVKKEKFRFGLQIFSDINSEKALSFWIKKLGVSRKQFGKVIVTPARGVGNYRQKTLYGVLTIYVSNKKLRDLIVAEVEKL